MNVRHLAIACLAIGIPAAALLTPRPDAARAAATTALKQRVEARWQLHLSGDLEHEQALSDPTARDQALGFLGGRRPSVDFSAATIVRIDLDGATARVLARYDWKPDGLLAALNKSSTSEKLDIVEHWRWLAGDQAHPANWYLVKTERAPESR
ncbi:MAG: hypothetical protein U1E76_00760 [Planctomycetota bacterium]